mmetsp:Transcript_46988/g.105904  ORF Transcript_46988/g.105904 Transcript_46988/m.105904 type:complete len:208 (+) Transcript_46988:331-954(+)
MPTVHPRHTTPSTYHPSGDPRAHSRTSCSPLPPPPPPPPPILVAATSCVLRSRMISKQNSRSAAHWLICSTSVVRCCSAPCSCASSIDLSDSSACCAWSSELRSRTLMSASRSALACSWRTSACAATSCPAMEESSRSRALSCTSLALNCCACSLSREVAEAWSSRACTSSLSLAALSAVSSPRRLAALARCSSHAVRAASSSARTR